MDLLHLAAIITITGVATVAFFYFLSKWMDKAQAKDNKAWAMKTLHLNEEEYEEYKELSKAFDREREEKARKEALETLEFLREKYGNK